MPTIRNVALAMILVLVSCMAIAATGYSMGDTKEPAAEAAQAEIVFYYELRNLGGGTYLCEVWTQHRVDATIMKLTASEKAKLQRSYIK